ncbi:hypothetical protein [Dokdonia sp.]|uniref:hypothetical protein n=1 Tax=Dokdonia sp. TaxID=2024995 RepID=UPI00326387E3
MKFFKYIIPLTMIILLVECKGDHSNNENDDNDGPPTVVVDAPEMIIPIQRGAQLFYNYKENRIPLIEEYENSNSSDGEEEYLATTSITFDFEMMKQYMKYVEQEAQAAHTDIKGLRVYLGQYSKNKNEKHPRAETVFFNPTMQLKSGNEVAFAIYNQNGNPVAIPVGELVDYSNIRGSKGQKKQKIQNKNDDDVTSLVGNDGHRRPPPINNEDGDY